MLGSEGSPPLSAPPASPNQRPRRQWPWSCLTRWGLLRRLDHAAIEQAIRNAELHTSGEIRVSIAGFFRGDARHLAEHAFERLGMDATGHRNGVLILVAPTRRQVIILGDAGIHQRVGEAFWAGIAATLSGRFGDREFTDGLVQAIERVGAELAIHFPPDPEGDVNELPNTVDVAGRRGP